jgi:hypothetical protein
MSEVKIKGTQSAYVIEAIRKESIRNLILFGVLPLSNPREVNGRMSLPEQQRQHTSGSPP